MAYRTNSLNHTSGTQKAFFSISYFRSISTCLYLLQTSPYVRPNFCTPYCPAFVSLPDLSLCYDAGDLGLLQLFGVNSIKRNPVRD